MVLLVSLLAGVLLGLACGGSIGNLKGLQLRGETPFVALVFATALAPRLFELAPAMVQVPLRFVWALGIVALVVLAAANSRTPGIPLIGAGLALNLVVIMANGGMPVASAAVSAIGGDPAILASTTFHVGATEGTRFLLLGDLLPVPGPGASIASLGDMLMLAGVVVVLAWGMSMPTRGINPRNVSIRRDAPAA